MEILTVGVLYYVLEHLHCLNLISDKEDTHSVKSVASVIKGIDNQLIAQLLVPYTCAVSLPTYPAA